MMSNSDVIHWTQAVQPGTVGHHVNQLVRWEEPSEGVGVGGRESDHVAARVSESLFSPGDNTGAKLIGHIDTNIQ